MRCLESQLIGIQNSLYLATYVATLRPDEQWIFPSLTSESGRTVNLDKPFRGCVLAAGLDVKQVVRHTLRHTAITHLVQPVWICQQ